MGRQDADWIERRNHTSSALAEGGKLTRVGTGRVSSGAGLGRLSGSTHDAPAKPDLDSGLLKSSPQRYRQPLSWKVKRLQSLRSGGANRGGSRAVIGQSTGNRHAQLAPSLAPSLSVGAGGLSSPRAGLLAAGSV